MTTPALEQNAVKTAAQLRAELSEVEDAYYELIDDAADAGLDTNALRYLSCLAIALNANAREETLRAMESAKNDGFALALARTVRQLLALRLELKSRATSRPAPLASPGFAVSNTQEIQR